MKTFKTKEALKRGWELFKRHRNVLLFSTLIILGINGTQSVRSHDIHELHSSNLFFGLLVFVVVNMLHIGWTKMLLKITDGESTSISEMVKHADLFIKFICVIILFGLLVGVSMIFLVIPGIYFALKYVFAPVIVIDQYVGIKGAFNESARITKGVKWKLLGFGIVVIFINIVGAMALLVGLLVTIPVTTLAFIHVYRTLSRDNGQKVESIPSPIDMTNQTMNAA